VRDVLFLAPQRLVHRIQAKAASAPEGQEVTLVVTIESVQRPARHGHPWKVRVFDDTGFVTLVFFRWNGPPLGEAHPVGARRVVSGKIERSEFDHALQIIHPDYFLPADRAAEVPEADTIYPATANLASRAVRRFALEALARAPQLPEW